MHRAQERRVVAVGAVLLLAVSSLLLLTIHDQRRRDEAERALLARGPQEADIGDGEPGNRLRGHPSRQPIISSIPNASLDVEEVFRPEVAQAATQRMVVPIPASYAKDFRRDALSWPECVNFNSDGTLLMDSPLVNPDAKRLAEIDQVELRGIITQYNADLTALSDLSYVLACDAMKHYFESYAGGGWKRNGNSKEEPRGKSQRGVWNRNLLLKHGGWERRIAFDSADYDYLEAHLKSVRELKNERLAAVQQFIAGLE